MERIVKGCFKTDAGVEAGRQAMKKVFLTSTISNNLER